MKRPVQPSDETRRLEALREYNWLDTPPEPEFDELTALVAHICEAPISLISLIDEQRQWFKSKFGLSSDETPRAISFCGHTILQRDLLIVPDAARDERFADNPLVTGDPHIRFYAGAPLVTVDGHALGTLSVIDRVPRQLSPLQREALRVLSRQVMARLELRRQAGELIESETRLFKVFRNCPVALSIHRWSDRTFVDVNPAFSNLVGWTREEVLGHTLMDLHIVEVDTEAQLSAGLDPIRSLNDVELAIRTRGGEMRHILFSTALIELRGEQHAVTTFIDITDRKRAEEALRDSEARLRLSVSAANIGLWDWDLATNQVHYSREWKSQIGYAEDEIPDRVEEAQSHVHPDDLGPQMQKIRAFLEDPRVRHEAEYRLRHKDGSYRWINSQGDVLRDVAGRPVRMLGCHIDITERKRAEEALRRSEA